MYTLWLSRGSAFRGLMADQASLLPRRIVKETQRLLSEPGAEADCAYAHANARRLQATLPPAEGCQPICAPQRLPLTQPASCACVRARSAWDQRDAVPGQPALF